MAIASPDLAPSFQRPRTPPCRVKGLGIFRLGVLDIELVGYWKPSVKQKPLSLEGRFQGPRLTVRRGRAQAVDTDLGGATAEAILRL